MTDLRLESRELLADLNESGSERAVRSSTQMQNSELILGLENMREKDFHSVATSKFKVARAT